MRYTYYALSEIHSQYGLMDWVFAIQGTSVLSVVCCMLFVCYMAVVCGCVR